MTTVNKDYTQHVSAIWDPGEDDAAEERMARYMAAVRGQSCNLEEALEQEARFIEFISLISGVDYDTLRAKFVHHYQLREAANDLNPSSPDFIDDTQADVESTPALP